MKPGDLITINKMRGRVVQCVGDETKSWVSIYREPSGDSGATALIESTAVGLLLYYDEKTHWGLCLFSGLRLGWLNVPWIQRV